MALRRPLCLALMVGLVAILGGCLDDHVRSDDLYPDDPAFMIDEDAEIRDTPEVRDVLDVLYEYRQALVSKDFGTINRIVSQDYYDNAGTTHTAADDYDYSELSNIYELMAEYADSIQYEVTVHDVVVDGDLAHVDYQFQYAFQYRVADQEAWDAGMDVNRMEFLREGDRWRIISGM